MRHVFLSYCNDDRDCAREICTRLEHAGISCWIAPRDVVAGKTYGEQIIEAIEDTAVMVLLLSAKANASPFVASEVERAASKHKPIVTYRIENVLPARSLELFVSASQWIDAWRDPLDGAATLATAIAPLLGAPTEPPRGRRAPLAPARRMLRRRVAVGVAVGVATLAAAMLYERSARVAPDHVSVAGPAATRPNRIAVMVFEKQHVDDPNDDWYGKGLQTALNTKLSQVPQLSVVAPEIIERIARETGTDMITAASRLGVERVVSGYFWVQGSILNAEVRIVNTGDGLQESGESVQRPKEEFSALQRDLTQRTLDHFHVRLTTAEASEVQKPTNSRADKYRALLGAEGVTDRAAEAAESPPGPQSLERDGWARRLAALGASGVAYAQASSADGETAVRDVLARYRQAYERGNLEELASLYVSFPEPQRRALGEYLRGVEDLHVQLDKIDIQPRDHEMVVSYIRRDRFIDKESGEPVTLEVKVTKFMVQHDGAWKFAPGGG